MASVDYQEFKRSGDIARAFVCKGRLCAKCEKCRDWYFTGDSETWNWVRSWKTWNDDDWKRYRDEQICKSFKRRKDGALCRGEITYDGTLMIDGLIGGSYGRSRSIDGCVCDDNEQSKIALLLNSRTSTSNIPSCPRCSSCAWVEPYDRDVDGIHNFDNSKNPYANSGPQAFNYANDYRSDGIDYDHYVSSGNARLAGTGRLAGADDRARRGYIGDETRFCFFSPDSHDKYVCTNKHYK